MISGTKQGKDHGTLQVKDQNEWQKVVLAHAFAVCGWTFML
jgi:hypothetical protein